MKASELRIGNYLEMLGKVRKVECISNLPARKEMYWLTCENMIDTKIIHFKPIPLTEEWLLKFGFEKTESDYRIKIQKDDKGGNTDYWIYVDSGFDNETNKFFVQIVCQEGCWFTSKNEHVHQLQNLYFSLTNKELKVI